MRAKCFTSDIMVRYTSVDTLPTGPAARWCQVAVRSHLAVCAGMSCRRLQDYTVPGSRTTSTIGLPVAVRS